MPPPAYSLELGLAAILSPMVAVVVWRRRPLPGAAPFTLLMFAAAEWFSPTTMARRVSLATRRAGAAIPMASRDCPEGRL